MKPITANELTDTAEAIFFIESRAELLQSLCKSAQDAAHPGQDNDTNRQRLNTVFNMLLILEDELEYLQEEIEIAGDMAQNDRTAAKEQATTAEK